MPKNSGEAESMMTVRDKPELKLQDFVYALVKSKMDTDFEDECREIVISRNDAQDRLKKIDKELKKLPLQSPSKMLDMAAIVSTACQVCSSRGDEDAMLLCDGCDNGYHTYCTEPPIETVPEGDWFCKECDAMESKVQTPNSTDSKKVSSKAKRKCMIKVVGVVAIFHRRRSKSKRRY